MRDQIPVEMDTISVHHMIDMVRCDMLKRAYNIRGLWIGKLITATGYYNTVMRDASELGAEIDLLFTCKAIDNSAVSMLLDEFYSMIEGYEYTDDQGWWFNRERASYHMNSLTGAE